MTAASSTSMSFLATDKCNSFHFDPKNPNLTYKYNDIDINQQHEPIRDLGIYFASDFSFNFHIKLISKKAKQKLYLLLKSLHSNDPSLLTQMYCTYVRPHLEFCSPIYNPSLKYLSEEIEGVQRLATRLICNRKPNLTVSSYEERLNTLNLISLRDRRTATDVGLLHQIYFKQAHISENTPAYPKMQFYSPRHEGMRFYIPNCKSEIRRKSFLIRAANTFNSLPQNLKLKFKQKNFKELVLDHLWSTGFKG